MAVVSTTRVAPAANARLDRLGGIDAAGKLQRARRLRDATAPTASRLTGLPARAPSKSTRWMSRAPSATSRSTIRSGRSVGAPVPAAAPGQ